jgi:hypothetical protein
LKKKEETTFLSEPYFSKTYATNNILELVRQSTLIILRRGNTYLLNPTKIKVKKLENKKKPGSKSRKEVTTI